MYASRNFSSGNAYESTVRDLLTFTDRRGTKYSCMVFCAYFAKLVTKLRSQDSTIYKG